jgi:hypothetical protein
VKQVGRPKFEPAEKQRAQVAALVACGVPRAQVATFIGVDNKTLTKYFRKELKEAKHLANSRIATTLYQKALAGDVVCMLFWLKCQANWKESSRHELCGPDGRPLPSQHLSLGISFADGGPGLPRRVPYDIEADSARIAALPPGADYLPGSSADADPTPPPKVAPSADTKRTWELLGLSKDEFDKQKPQ